MKKSDLKTGHLVQMRDGDWYVVCLNVSNETYTKFLARVENDRVLRYSLDFFDEKLTNTYNCENCDIIKVANCNQSFDFFNRNTTKEYIESLSGFKVIWQEESLKTSDITVKIKAELDKESVEKVEEEIEKLQKRLSNLKINLKVGDDL